MDKYDICLTAKKLDHSVIISPIAEWCSSPRTAFDDVINANTEFKNEFSEESVSTRSPIDAFHVENLQEHGSNTSRYQCAGVRSSEKCGVVGGTTMRNTPDILKHSVVPKVHISTVNHILRMDKKDLNDLQLSQHLNISQITDSINMPSFEKGDFLTPVHSYAGRNPRDSQICESDCSPNIANQLSNSHQFNDAVQRVGQCQCKMNTAYTEKTMDDIDNRGFSAHECQQIEIKRNHLRKCENNIVCGSASDADHILWPPQETKKGFDNVSLSSSHFDAESISSDVIETVSTVSDVSGYEEEIFRIKRLLLQDPSVMPLKKQILKKKTDCSEVTANRNEVFCRSDETNAHSLTEIHRKKLLNDDSETEKLELLTRKLENEIGLKWQEKCQEILREKAHVEGRLESLLSEVEILRREKQDAVTKAKRLESEASSSTALDVNSLIKNSEKAYVEKDHLQTLLREKTKENQELKSVLGQCDADKNRLRDEIKSLESINEKLRIELQELNVEFESKVESVTGLKTKITDLHMECQSLLQGKLRAENAITTIKNDLTSSQKLVTWYRDQLHLSQSAKAKVQEELMTTQVHLMSCSHVTEKLRVEKLQMQQLIEDLEQRSVKEKQNLVRQLETIQSDILSRETAILNQVHSDRTNKINNATSTVDSKSLQAAVQVENSSATVLNLEQEINELKNYLQLRDNKVTELEEENVSLLTRVKELQRTLNEKEILQQGLENKYSHLEISNQHLNEVLKTKEQNLIEMKNEKIGLEVTLSAALKEKAEIDSSVKQLHEDISRIKASYTTMKTELLKKQKEISDMREKLAAEKCRFENDMLKDKEQTWGTDLASKTQPVKGTSNSLKEELEKGKRPCKLYISEIVSVIKEINHGSIEDNEEAERKLEEILKCATRLTCEPETNINPATLSVADWLDTGLQIFLQTHKGSESDTSEMDIKCQDDPFNNENTLSAWVSKLAKANAVLEFLTDFRQELLLNIETLTPEKRSLEERAQKLKLNTSEDNFSSTKVNKPSYENNNDVLSGSENEYLCCTCRQSEAYCSHYKKELEKLKCQKRKLEVELQEKSKNYQSATRILLRKLKEHIRGRKTAERQLEYFKMHSEIFRSDDDISNYEAKIKNLELELENSYKQLEQQKNLAEKYHNSLLNLERDRGKLEQKQSMIQEVKDVTNAELPSVVTTVDDKRKELKYQQALTRLCEAEEEAETYIKLSEELKTEVLTQKSEISKLQQVLKSVQTDLNNVCAKLERKSSELKHLENLYEEATNRNSYLQEQLDSKPNESEEYQKKMISVKLELEETKARYSVLEDQIKTLTYHVHQKTEEITALEEKAVIEKENWKLLENGFKRKISLLEMELSKLKDEMGLLHHDKLRLQTLSSELKAALQSVIKQNEVLKEEMKSCHAGTEDENQFSPPNNIAPPAIYNEAQIEDLLHRSSIFQQSKPLNNLQCCLNSLKLEMAMLQEQLAAKTSQIHNESFDRLPQEELGVQII